MTGMTALPLTLTTFAHLACRAMLTPDLTATLAAMFDATQPFPFALTNGLPIRFGPLSRRKAQQRLRFTSCGSGAFSLSPKEL